MAPVLEVDVDALNADGRRLESLGRPVTPSNCAPPGSDSTSLGAARVLNSHEMALIELLDYATRVRETGGAVIRSAAVVFELADRAGAESIHRVDNTNAPPITSSSGPPQMPTLPPVPSQPPIASIPQLPALPSIAGEQFSAQLHSGPGSADLRDFSRAWHSYSQDITHTADDTRSVGGQVNEHWSSGYKAANSITNHANYLDSAAAWAERLSVGAEAVAHAFDIAKQDTPTPDEFSGAESDVMEAAALMAVSPAVGMIEYQQATSRYAELVAKAEVAAKQYHASVSAALTGIGNPMVPCPPIASKGDIPLPLGPESPDRSLSDLFDGRIPKASELEEYAFSQGWTKTQTPGGPPKYVDENGIVRMTIKEGSPRTPGSETPHVELRDATGQRIDPNGNPVSRRSPGNHTPIVWDW
jgi:hypothetical protein